VSPERGLAPAAPQAHDPGMSANAAKRAQPASPTSPRVLIVEDDADIRETLAELLATAGYDTAQAANGREALDQARRAPPDLIVLDLMMPVMDGWQFRSAQRRDPALAPIPVIVVSASGATASIDADAFLQKPFPMERLVAEAERLRRA
jgi:CheY-like chemotaxis protein